jgi:hypothetical protein
MSVAGPGILVGVYVRGLGLAVKDPVGGSSVGVGDMGKGVALAVSAAPESVPTASEGGGSAGVGVASASSSL